MRCVKQAELIEVLLEVESLLDPVHIVLLLSFRSLNRDGRGVGEIILSSL